MNQYFPPTYFPPTYFGGVNLVPAATSTVNDLVTAAQAAAAKLAADEATMATLQQEINSDQSSAQQTSTALQSAVIAHYPRGITVANVGPDGQPDGTVTGYISEDQVRVKAFQFDPATSVLVPPASSSATA